ncbi:MAG: c-type cytochrome [Acidobacteriota bacterium]
MPNVRSTMKTMAMALFLALGAAALAHAADGKAIFLAQKCNMCHSVPTADIASKIKSSKMKGPDLVNVAKRHDAEWIAKFLHRQVKQHDALHKKEFKGSDEDLKALIDWILAQKKD